MFAGRKTTMVFALLWGLWHVPLFFIHGYCQNELWNTGIVYVIDFFAQLLAATVLMGGRRCPTPDHGGRCANHCRVPTSDAED